MFNDRSWKHGQLSVQHAAVTSRRWQDYQPNTDSEEFLKSDMLKQQPALHCTGSSLSSLSLLLQWLQQTRKLDFFANTELVFARSRGLVMICHTDDTVLVCEGISKVSLFRRGRNCILNLILCFFLWSKIQGIHFISKIFSVLRFETPGCLFVSLLLGHVVSEGYRCSHSGIFNHFHRLIRVTVLPSCPFSPSLHSWLLPSPPLLLARSSSFSSDSSRWTSSPDSSHTGRGGADSGHLWEVRLWNRPPVLSWPQPPRSQFMIPYPLNAHLALLSPYQHFRHSFSNLVLSWKGCIFILSFHVQCDIPARCCTLLREPSEMVQALKQCRPGTYWGNNMYVLFETYFTTRLCFFNA